MGPAREPSPCAGVRREGWSVVEGVGLFRNREIPISSKMACLRLERCSVMLELKSIAHDDRIFTLVRGEGVVIFTLTDFSKTKLFINF